jgi:hypothetical protein
MQFSGCNCERKMYPVPDPEQPGGGHGSTVPGSQKRSCGNVFSLFAAHRQAGLDITPETPISNWLGERMDDSMAVEGLLQRE